MGHDHSLGSPVDIGVQEDANHSGPCNDGVYGCSRCFNGANDGKGTIGECEWCKSKDEYLRITRASDEPVSYAVCAPCRKRQEVAIAAELAEYQNSLSWDYDDEDD